MLCQTLKSAPGIAAAAPKLQVRASQLAGEWACEIKKQRDPIHTFAPTRISFVEMPRLPANLYVAYFERSFQESKESAPLRYLEYYEGFWNIKDGNRVFFTLSPHGVKRLYKPEDIKDPALRQQEQETIDFLEKAAQRKGFKSGDMRVLAIKGDEMDITDDESLLHCRKKKPGQKLPPFSGCHTRQRQPENAIFRFQAA